MDEKTINEIKEKIIIEIDKAEKSIIEYKEITKPIAPENAIGRISRMDAINNKSVTEAALRTAEEKLSKLNYMLTQIDDDNFGICAKCKKPIPIGRILLMPQSRHCVNCAQ
ncbi:MAG: TraR/DksA C4-type zinc finger protein [Bacteroidales bacterium]|jgi:DnaK suppressor protein|nr:TraR/DksA C4-type zinc finger protein [Bacteroidales bacterium]